VLANDVRDRQEYLTVSCAGRGKRLSRINRAELWEIFKRFELILEQEGCLTFTQIAALALPCPRVPATITPSWMRRRICTRPTGGFCAMSLRSFSWSATPISGFTPGGSACPGSGLRPEGAPGALQ
jgi:hypothetical protein